MKVSWTTLLVVFALSLFQIKSGNAGSNTVCTPTPYRSTCSKNADCTGCNTGTFIFDTSCVTVAGDQFCYCGKPGFGCTNAKCCDGTPCPKSGVCPPAQLYGLCLLSGCNQCAEGTCQSDTRAIAVMNGLVDWGICQ